MPSDRLPSAPPDAHPEVIGGRYRVERAIGRGGMGTVWLCRDEMLRRDVAVKRVGLLPGESVTDSARALREARSSAALSHRNVVTVFDVVDEDGAIWLVMEHVPSHSLADLVAKEGPLDPARVADIGAQVADGLAAAHAAGTMHRDVKPGNVLIRDDGTAKISDFGIARSAGDPALTQSGLLTGTPSYFSPELARGASPDLAADVWALGATLYAAVEGRPPYAPKQNPVAILHDIATEQPPAPRRADFLEPVLLRMLDRNPQSRWSMADAAHALHRLVRDHPVVGIGEDTRAETVGEPVHHPPAAPVAAAAPARAAASPTPSSTGTPSSAPGPSPAPSAARSTSSRPPSGSRPPRRRRGALAALLAVVALLVAAGAVYTLTRDTGADPSDTARGGATPSQSPSSGEGSSSSGSAEPSGAASGSSTGDAGSAPSAGSAASGSGSSGSGSGALAQQEDFLKTYFEEAPGGSDEAWAQLGPREKQVGRSSFNGFWRTIESAQVRDVVAGDAADTVEATIRYRYANGKVVEERQRLELIRSGGEYLIDDDTVLSSRTVNQ
jgi:serine/threonine protein kinase